MACEGEVMVPSKHDDVVAGSSVVVPTCADTLPQAWAIMAMTMVWG